MGRTIAQKIFDTHRVDSPVEGVEVLRLDKVFCHEITTPPAILDLIERGKDRVFDPERIKVVIDHVTPAKDLKTALQGKILRDWVRRQNIRDFFDIGRNGVCHALFPEKGFIRPGETVIMGDSHTCTHGAFGAFAAGVGTTDLEVGILKGVCAFKSPVTMKISVTGDLPRGVYAKDVILAVLAKITTNGATDRIIEFSGPVIDSFGMGERMTLCNMAVEGGATSGICKPDEKTVAYLLPHLPEGTDGGKILEEYSLFLPDEDAEYYETLVLDVTGLEPLATVGYKPDTAVPVRELKSTRIDQVYIGSCTNGRIEDLRAAAAVIKGGKVHPLVRAILSPATPDVYREALEEGLIDIFLSAGFCITNPTCGACLGMSNGVLAEGEVCASTTNRNFNGRMGKGGMIHLVSPATAAASALTGYLSSAETI